MADYYLLKDGRIVKKMTPKGPVPAGRIFVRDIDTNLPTEITRGSIVQESTNVSDLITLKRRTIATGGTHLKPEATEQVIKAPVPKAMAGPPRRIKPEPQLLRDIPKTPKTVPEKVMWGIQDALGGIGEDVVSGLEGAIEATQPTRTIEYSYGFMEDKKWVGTETKGGVTYNVYEKLPPKVRVLEEKEQFPIIQPMIRGGVEAMQWGVVTVPLTAYQLGRGEKDLTDVLDDVVGGVGATVARIKAKPVTGIAELGGGLIVAGKMFNVPVKALRGSKTFKYQKVSGYTNKAGKVIKPYKRVVRKQPYIVERATGVTELESRVAGVKKLGKKDAVSRSTQLIEEPSLTRVVTVKDLKQMPKQDLSMVEASGFVGGIQESVAVSTITKKGWKVKPTPIDPFELITLKGKGAKMVTQDVNLFTGDIMRSGYSIKRVFRPVADLDILGTAPIKVMKGRLPKSRRTPLVFEKELIGVPDSFGSRPIRGTPVETGGGLLTVAGEEIMPRTMFREVPISMKMPVFKESKVVAPKGPSHPFGEFVASGPYDALGRMFSAQKARPMPSHPKFRSVPTWVQDDIVGSAVRGRVGPVSKGKTKVGTFSDDIMGMKPTQTSKIRGRDANIFREMFGQMPRARQSARMRQAQRSLQRQSLALDVFGDYAYPRTVRGRMPFSFPFLGGDIKKGRKARDDFIGFQPSGYQASVTAVLLGVGSTKMPKGDMLTGFELRPVIRRRGVKKRGQEKKQKKEKEVMRDVLGF